MFRSAPAAYYISTQPRAQLSQTDTRDSSRDAPCAGGRSEHGLPLRCSSVSIIVFISRSNTPTSATTRMSTALILPISRASTSTWTIVACCANCSTCPCFV